MAQAQEPDDRVIDAIIRLRGQSAFHPVLSLTHAADDPIERRIEEIQTCCAHQ